MKSVFAFLASTMGRMIRAMAGIALIALGFGVIGGVTGLILAIIGVAPLAAGLFDFCLFGALLGYGFSGNQVRSHTA